MISEIVHSSVAGFTWVDVLNPSEEELLETALAYQLQLKLLHDCMDSSHLPKWEKHGDITFLLLRTFDEGAGDEDCSIPELTQKIAIFLTHDLLITVHRQEIDFVGQIKKYTAYNKNEPRQAQFSILHFIIQEALYSYEFPLQNAEELFTELEESVFNDTADESILGEIYLLKRKLSVYRRMLRQMLDALRRLELNSQEEQKILDYSRTEGDRLISLTDASMDNLHNLVNLQMSFQSNKANEIIRVLTIYSAFFMPLTFIVDLYQANFETMPFLTSEAGNLSLWVLMFALCVGIYYWFNKKRWI